MMKNQNIDQLLIENKKLKEEIQRLTTIRDISDKKRVASNLKEREEFYRTLFEFSPSGVMIEDKNGKILDVSPAWCKSLGYKRNEIVGQKIHKLAHRDNYGKVDINIKNILSGEKLKQTVKSVRKDGTICYIQLNERSITLPNGEKGILSISQDMTKEAQALEALKQSEETYKGLFDNATDAIYIQDQEGRFLDVNKAVIKMYGYPKEFFIGKTPEPLSASGKNDLKKIALHVEKAFNGEPQQFEFWGKRKNGEIFPKIVRLNKGKYFGKDVIFAFAVDITDQKHAEQKLRESEEKFRSIFTNFSVGTGIVSLDGRFQIVNQKFADIVGYTIKELKEIRNDDLTHPEDNIETRENMKLLFEQKIDSFNLEKRLIHKNGNIVWVDLTVKPKYDSTGKIESVIGVVQDITKQKGAGDALRESEERFRTMFSQNSAVMLLIDPDDEQKILDANKAAEEFYGYKRLQLLQMKMGQINIIEDGKRKNLMDQAIKKPQNYFNFTHRLSNGELKDVEVYASPIMQQDKKCMFVIVHDITERKQAEREITRLATVVEQAVESIVITDIEGTIQYVNAAFEKITGYKKSEAMGQNPKMLKSGKHGKEFYEDLWSTILFGNKWQGVIVNKRKNGSLYYEKAVIFPIKNEYDKVINFTAIMRDITLERKLEQQLQQVQKMEAIGTLSGGIAHDFNNILTVINGHAEIGLMNVDQSHAVHDDLMSILNAGKRAEKLTNQLLAFSRKQIHELKVIDINQTIKDLDKMLRRLMPEDIKIISDFPEDLPYIKADPGQIEQIIINLIINARDAINEKQDKRSKKEIIVKTELLDLDHLFVDTHPGSQTGPHILMSVRDSGIGMNVDVQNRIFEPFFTTKDVDKGTGLGLATVYGIVKQNEGSIYVKSETGKGTSFEIYWPITTESPEKDYIETINQKVYSGKETILFVEDDEDVRQFACVALKSFGYNIIEANNGKNALQLVTMENTSIDIIITDLIMPEMNGQELASQVHSFLPNIKVIYVSGYTFEYLLKDGEIEESINFLQKPYTIQNILKKLRDTLDN